VLESLILFLVRRGSSSAEELDSVFFENTSFLRRSLDSVVVRNGSSSNEEVIQAKMRGP